jgi:hypothetical protein
MYLKAFIWMNEISLCCFACVKNDYFFSLLSWHNQLVVIPNLESLCIEKALFIYFLANRSEVRSNMKMIHPKRKIKWVRVYICETFKYVHYIIETHNWCLKYVIDTSKMYITLLILLIHCYFYLHCEEIHTSKFKYC